MKPPPPLPRQLKPARATTTLPTAAALLGTALALQGCMTEAHADPVPPAADAGVRPPQPPPHPQPVPPPQMPVPGGVGRVHPQDPKR
jgi:hypothetical protein